MFVVTGYCQKYLDLGITPLLCYVPAKLSILRLLINILSFEIYKQIHKRTFVMTGEMLHVRRLSFGFR
jgi:hypothetical protein